MPRNRRRKARDDTGIQLKGTNGCGQECLRRLVLLCGGENCARPPHTNGISKPSGGEKRMVNRATENGSLLH
jgi:hypothetical protein